MCRGEFFLKRMSNKGTVGVPKSTVVFGDGARRAELKEAEGEQEWS